MASTMTAARPLHIASVPGPALQSNEVPVHIQPLQQSASATAQQANTIKGATWSEADFVANLQSSTAQNGASGSVSSQQPQQGLSSLAQAAMAGGKMKTDTPTRPGQFGSNNSGNGMNTQAASPMPTPTSIGKVGMDNSSVPTCQNCQTSTTPLWRRDEIGSVLCNACGLFLKLHGRPRPISLKTDVIKSRNRVKTSGPGQGQKKKSLFDQQTHNGLGDPNQQHGQHGTPQQNQMNQQRRPSQRSQNGDANGSHSPISRTGTPNMYGNHMSAFNGNDLVDHQFHSPSLNGMHMGRAASPGRSESSMNANLDMPQTFEQLLAANSSLKTRVSELEVINELFRGRVTQLEQDEANARRGEEMRRESERNLRLHLEESQRRENNLKRALDDMHRQVAEMRGETLDELTHKKPRLDDGMQHMSHMADMGNMGQMSSLDQDNLDHMGQGLEHVDHNIDHSLDQHMDHNIDQSMDQKFDEQKFGENLRQDLAQNLDQNLDPALDPSLGDNNLGEKFENSNELVDPALNIKADEDALLADGLLDNAPTPEL